MEEILYKNRQKAINFLNINIKKWGTKNKVVYNKYHITEIICKDSIKGVSLL